MFILFVAISLALISVATFPCWPYSSRWGHLPSMIAGALLFFVAMVVVGGKLAPKAAELDREVASASPVTGTYNAFDRKVETVVLERENALR